MTAPGIIRLTEQFSDLELGDAWLNGRACALIEALGQRPDRAIPTACGTWKQTKKGAYRLIAPPYVRIPVARL